MKRITGILIIYVFCISCTAFYQTKKLTYFDYKVNSKSVQGDSVLVFMLNPYRDSVDRTMNVVIGVLEENLEKSQPNGSLGLVLADALKEQSARLFNTKVDAAFINNGGIRIPSVSKGNITIGTVFEIMPFDNVVVLQKINGKVLKSFLDHIASGGGWPVSGISMTIAGRKAEEILVNGLPIEDATMYTIVNSDYIVNGGDNVEMLRSIPQVNNNVLMRDMFIRFFKEKNERGERIFAPKEARIKKL